MSNKVKISDVLHLAADEYLYSADEWVKDKYRFSCIAIERSIVELAKNDTEVEDLSIRIGAGLSNLGLNTHCGQQFAEFEDYSFYPCPTEASQGARYAWLKFCAMLAEEQGD